GLPVPPFAVGDCVGPAGRYELLEKIDEGGQGVVFRAHQRDLGRTVALKVRLSAAPPTREGLERFRAEAAMLAQLAHPSIVTVHDYGEHQGWPFFVMEYMLKGSLCKKLHPGGPGHPRAFLSGRDAAEL